MCRTAVDEWSKGESRLTCASGASTALVAFGRFDGGAAAAACCACPYLSLTSFQHPSDILLL